MILKSKYIILLGLDDYIQDNVFEEIKKKLNYNSSENVSSDFYIEDIHKEVNDLVGIECSGVQVSVKHKYSYQKAELNYFSIPIDRLSILNNKLENSLNEIAPKQDIKLVFCFDYSNIINGYEAFDVVNTSGNNVIKFQLTEFMYSSYDFDRYNLLYIDDKIKRKELKYLYSNEYRIKKYVNGINLSCLLNTYNKDLLQYNHFLKLPTILLFRNIFLPKIPF